MTYDVIVIGLGGMGSAAAYHLAARGKSVLGLEQYRAAHNQGSSHGSSRIIRQAYHENPAYVPLVQRAYELWRKLEQDTGTRLLQITGGLMIGPPGSSVVEGTIRSAQEHRLSYQVFHSAELRQRFPAFNPRPDDTAVYEAEAGFLRPEACVEAHLHMAARHGAQLCFEEVVANWVSDADASCVRVVTNKGTYEAQHLVIAPGAWAPVLLARLGVPFEVRRHVMAWFQPVTNVSWFSPENLPIYIWDVDEHHCFYGFPATDGLNSGVKVAMHSGGDRCTPLTINREITSVDVEELRTQLRQFIPALNGDLLQAVACMYTMTPDEHFVLAKHPQFTNVSIAAGFSGHGFKFTSVVGEILADLTINGTTAHPIDLFSPERFKTTTA
jgi:sarcosine oxidase